MSHQVIWTEEVLQTFIIEACLTEEEEAIMRMRIDEVIIPVIAARRHIGARTVDRRINVLKQKYDAAVRANPLLPKREDSVYRKPRKPRKK